MTLHVVTLHFGELPYFADSREINRRYCLRHGLNFSACGSVVETDRHPVWSKVSLLSDALELDELVLFIDADAVFLDHEQSPERLLFLLGGKALLFPLDRAGQANTGVILARRCEATARILREWRDVPRRDGMHAFRWPLEQGALNKHVLGKYRHDIALPTRLELDIVRGNFIRHFAGAPSEVKAKRISEERSRLAQLHGW